MDGIWIRLASEALEEKMVVQDLVQDYIEYVVFLPLSLSICLDNGKILVNLRG